MERYLPQPGGLYGAEIGNRFGMMQAASPFDPQLPMAGSPFGSSNLYGSMAQMGGRYDPSAPGNGAAMSNLPNGANAANATFYRGLPPGFTKTVS